MAQASRNASSVPMARPARASSTETSAWAIRFGKSWMNALITSTGEGSMYSGTRPDTAIPHQISRISRNAPAGSSLSLILSDLFLN